jgi:hypothetical protein
MPVMARRHRNHRSFLQSMKHRIFIGAAALVMSLTSSAQIWATATAKSREGDRVIVYRFLKEFAPGFDKATQPERFTIIWKYQGNRGMPAIAERERMDAVEDALEAADGTGSSVTPVIVSTGNNVRQWIYYVQSRQEFADRLKVTLQKMPGLPLEVRSERDPEWKTYKAFKASVRD